MRRRLRAEAQGAEALSSACDTYRGGFGRYFLEGLPEFLDSPEEWLFDTDSKKVLLPTPGPKAGAAVRGRVRCVPV